MNILEEMLGGLSLKIINGDMVSHTKDWYDSKTKLYHTIWSIHKGVVHIVMGGREHTVRPGEAILFCPGDVYTAWSEDGCEFVYLIYKLELGFTADSPSCLGISGIARGELTSEACREFARDYKVTASDPRRAGLRCYAVFLKFFVSLLAAIKQGECLFLKKRDTPTPSTDMQRAIAYMDQHFSEGISVKEVATRFGIGEKHFITKFKAITGIPPKKYLTDCRMRRAAELLREGDTSICEVAAILGYSDQYSFSKAFKKHYGESPSAFK
ncbi:MAG: helix-turn-helix transcriptional regulator [Clostridia bacterium]|nr:helix-turn-helix transcriptional regulator [Clostridia bacterium]